jgi:hypothetical protein
MVGPAGTRAPLVSFMRSILVAAKVAFVLAIAPASLAIGITTSRAATAGVLDAGAPATAVPASDSTRVVDAKVARPDPAVSGVVLKGLGRFGGATILTTIAGLSVTGDYLWQRMTISDLDIILTDEGSRLVPILHLMKSLGVTVSDSASCLSFQAEDGPPTRIDYEKQEIRIGATSPRPVRAVIGSSDYTGLVDLFVEDAILPEILALPVAWNEAKYGYEAKTTKKLRLFEKRRKERKRTTAEGTRQMTVELPGNLPTAVVNRLSPPSVDFAELSFQMGLTRSNLQNGLAGTVSAPRAGVWTRLFGGDLKTTLISGTGATGPNGIRVRDASWTSAFGSNEIALGGAGFGLSDLIFPSLNLVGVRFNGIWSGTALSDTDPSRMGKQLQFTPTETFEGTARAGSRVTLYINGRQVAEQTAESQPGSIPGDGAYSFEGVNLLSNRTNNVRIVTVDSDSSVEESTREILASNLLAPRGSFLYMGGAGSRRMSSGDGMSSQGRFVGGRALYGITSGLTVGLSLAEQRDMFSRRIGTATFGQDSTLEATLLDSLPVQSYHAGARALWRPLGTTFASMEAAACRDPVDGTDGTALGIGLEWRMGRLRLRPEGFRYSPWYFGGTNAPDRDRMGGRLLADWQGRKVGRISAGWARATDNVDHSRPRTQLMNTFRADWDVPTPIPRTQARLGSRLSWNDGGGGTLRAHSIGIRSGFMRQWNIDTNFQFGGDDRRSILEGRDLLKGMGAGDLSSGGGVESRYRLSHRFWKSIDAAFLHRSGTRQRKTYLDLNFQKHGDWQIRTRLMAGHDWIAKGPFSSFKLDVPLDRLRRNSVGFDLSYSPTAWSVHLGFQTDLLFGFSGPRPYRISGVRIDPESGGVRGRVFLDMNSNGLPDAGEPGLPRMSVLTDLGDHAETGSDGSYVLPGNPKRNRIRVSLNPQTLPAIYTPTQGTQEAQVRPGLLTVVNLGVGVYGTISGSVRDTTAADSTKMGVDGIRVLLVAKDGTVMGSSITAKDGTWYIGEVKPGDYLLQMDPGTLPFDFRSDEMQKEIQMPKAVEPVAIEGIAFIGRRTAPEPEVKEEKLREVKFKKF